MTEHRIFTMPFSAVYPAYVNTAERKGRTKKIRQLDKLVDELAKGKALEKVLRS
jgi:hypothetical protein